MNVLVVIHDISDLSGFAAAESEKVTIRYCRSTDEARERMYEQIKAANVPFDALVIEQHARKSANDRDEPGIEHALNLISDFGKYEALPGIVHVMVPEGCADSRFAEVVSRSRCDLRTLTYREAYAWSWDRAR